MIRPDSTIWTPERAAVGRSRRRHPTGPPLCSTTFGGSTIPPLFTGGAALPLIFLRDTGNWYNKDVDGDGVFMDKPTIAVNDDLFVFQNSAFFTPNVSNPSWTRVLSYNGQACEIFHRVADGTAADEFFMPVVASTRNRLAQMASFGNSDPGSPPDSLNQFQGGGLQDGGAGASTLWPYFAMTAGPDPTDTLVLYFSFKLRTGVGVANTVTANPELPEIGSIAYTQASPIESQWLSWGWQFQAASVAMNAGASMTYTNTVTFGIIMSQYTRWSLS